MGKLKNKLLREIEKRCSNLKEQEKLWKDVMSGKVEVKLDKDGTVKFIGEFNGRQNGKNHKNGKI